MERWLALRAGGEALDGDLRLALHGLGAARLAEVAELSVAERGDVALPVRAGLEPVEAGGSRARRRCLPVAALSDTLKSVRDLLVHLDAWPQRAALAEALAWLRELVQDELGWLPGTPVHDVIAPLWEAPDARLDAPLDREDFLLIVERQLADAGRAPLGGAGAGVQVLSVMEARARSFDALFGIGMNRDVFPRSITEDPLLPDGLRARLRAVLPDLPVKREGTHEERYLFAQLLAASPRITLSCSVADDSGKPRLPSPLLERLRLAGHVGEPEGLPALHGRGRAASERACTADELAIAAGLHGTRRRFEKGGGRRIRAGELRDRAGARVDLASGAWHERYGDVAALDELDAGYRLLVAERH